MSSLGRRCLIAALAWLSFVVGPAAAEILPQTIYAGDTPLASTCALQHIPPLTLQVGPCQFTTTGQARILPVTPETAALVSAGKAELLPDGMRMRQWLERDGVPLRSVTATLPAEAVFTLTPHPLFPTDYLVDLVRVDTTRAMSVLLRSQIADGLQRFASLPAGLSLLQPFTAFRLPAAALTLTGVTIRVFTVVPGFPPRTGPSDFTIQSGEVR